MQKINLMGSFIIEPVQEVLEFWNSKLAGLFSYSFAPYNQFFQQVLDDKSSEQTKEIHVVLLRVSDILPQTNAIPETIIAQENLRMLSTSMLRLAKRAPLTILAICPDAPLGDDSLENILIDVLNGIHNLIIISGQEMIDFHGHDSPFNPITLELAHVPYEPSFYATVGTLILRKLIAHIHPPRKVIVLDADHTLWRGICSENSVEELLITPAFLKLHSFMLDRKAAGMLLCLASKNVLEDVKIVFDQHPDMLLKWDDFIACKINLQPKHENLKALAQELNLSLESFVFLDDNPIECQEMLTHCPEVLTLLLPPEEDSIHSYLQNVWFFDRQNLTKEDLHRHSHYKLDADRKSLRGECLDLNTFLKELKTQVSIEPVKPEQMSRVSQLTFRTNQMNCSCLRFTENELEDLLNKGRMISTVTVTDRFGHYGLVGVIIFSAETADMQVDVFLLSCRVLNRTVEQHMLNYLAEMAQLNRSRQIKFLFTETGKNLPALRLMHALQAESVPVSAQERFFIVPLNTCLKLPMDLKDLTDVKPLTETPKLSSNTRSFPAFNHAKTSTFAAETAKLCTGKQVYDAVQKSMSQKPCKLSKSYTSPSNSLENQLVSLWQKVLHISPIGIDDDFFALGGTSLKAIELIATIYKEYGVLLPMSIFMKQSNVSCCAAAIVKLKASGESNSFVTYPVFPAQHRLWFLTSILPKATFNIPLVFDIKGPLHSKLFKKSLDLLFWHYSILRSSFAFTSDGLRGREMKNPIGFSLVESACEDANALDSVLQQDAWTPFDFERGPLVRGKLIILEPGHYCFLFVIHHLIADEASLAILLTDLSLIYRCLCREEFFPLSTRSNAFLRQNLSENKNSIRNLEYWKQELANWTPLMLPKTYQMPLELSHRASTHLLSLPASLLQKLQSLGVQNRATLFMILLTGFYVLLHRYTDQDDLLIGAPIAQRQHPDALKLIGPLVNLLPLRLRFAGNPSFSELLALVRNLVIEAFDHQETPFEAIVDALEIKRVGQMHPLVQVGFTLRSEPMALDLEGCVTKKRTLSAAYTALDLTLIAETDHEGLKLHFEYANQLFSSHFIQQMAGHFSNLLHAIVADPGTPIGFIAMLSKEELKERLQAKNSVRQQNDCSFDEMIAKQAERIPTAIAVIQEEKMWSYSELNKRANQIAFSLQKRGVKHKDLVGVCLIGSFDYFCAVLAILKCGAAFIPLDADYPDRYLQQILSESCAQWLVTIKKYQEKPALWNGARIFLDDEMIRYDEEFVSQACPAGLAYVIFTSGSTGTPKGVMIDHRALCNLAHGAAERFYLDHSSRMLQFASLSFDASIAEWASTFCAGGSLVLLDKEERLCVFKLKAIIDNQSVTTLILPPSYALLLPEHAKFSSLKTLIVAGEVNLQLLVERWAHRVQFVNAYGPTEAGVMAASHRYGSHHQVPAATIGTSLPNIELYICDRYGNLVPEGVQGELYIAGLGVSQGYLHQPELTAASFIIHALAKDEQPIRLYKSNDLVRYRDPGVIEFLGRKDNQVQIRGHRIELEQVEAALLQYADIAKACVSVQICGLRKELVAYVEFNKQFGHTDVQSIKEFLKERLPSYMVPGAICTMPTLPLLPNGKIARHLLPKNSLNNHISAGIPDKTSEMNVLHIALIATWQKILGVQGISIRDNFFDLGGNSLKVIQACADFYENYGQVIDSMTFYAYPTIKQLTDSLMKKNDSIAHLLSIQRAQAIEKNLFLIHPSLGLALPYLSLREKCLPGIYGIDNLYPGKKYFSTLQEMARCYVDRVLKAQPHGTYYLGGWSFGGVVAYEMAQQMVAAGMQVDLVILIDSYLCNATINAELSTRKLEVLTDYGIEPSSQQGCLLQKEMQHNAAILNTYEAKGYGGRVALLQANGPQTPIQLESWQALIRNLSVHPVEGSHHELFHTQNIHAMADQLNAFFS